eukprot:2682656-Karenia_brevis.AAC.1
MAHAAAQGDMRAFFKAAKPYYKPVRTSCSQVVTEEGTHITSYAGIRQSFMNHFSKLLQGSQLTFGDLVDKFYETYYNPQHHSFDASCIDYSLFQCLDSVFKMLKNQGGIKGVGEDCLGNEIGRVFPLQVAKHLVPIFFKSVLYMRAPIQMRGGQIQEIFKSGSAQFLRNYRDVMLASLA